MGMQPPEQRASLDAVWNRVRSAVLSVSVVRVSLVPSMFGFRRPVDDAVLGAPFLDALGWRWQRPRSTKFTLVLQNSSAALQLDKKFSGVIISIMHQVASFGARVLLAGRCPLLRRTLVS